MYLILGLLGLVIGAELIIRGSLNIAEHYKISHFFIGLTVLAMGTDLPELAIVITGAFHKLGGIDTSGLIVGEAVGSSFGQIALALGILALFGTLVLKKRELKRDGLVMLGSVVLLFLVSLDGIITTAEGVMFIFFYLLYFRSLITEEKIREKVARAPRMYMRWVVLSLVAGFILLVYSSDVVVNNAVQLASIWGVSQALIGALIVGLGSSLPEISVSLGALRKKAVRLSVGNLVGSNIFDVLFTLGIAASIAGLNIGPKLINFDIPYLFVVSLMVLLMFAVRKRMGRKEAVVAIALYGMYVAMKLIGF